MWRTKVKDVFWAQ